MTSDDSLPESPIDPEGGDHTGQGEGDEEDDEGDDPSQGESVFSVSWDGGMMSNGSFYIYLYNNLYYLYESDSRDSRGPYGSLDEALEECEVFSGMVGSATESIDCAGKTAEQIAALICTDLLEEGQTITINNRDWVFKEETGLTPSRE